MILTCFIGLAMLNFWLDSSFLSYGAKGSFAIMNMLDLVEEHKFLFVANISCTKYESENEM
jgi:hypothetical protein